MTAPSASAAVPPAPAAPDDLLAWAAAHDVLDRLDDIVVGPRGPLYPPFSGPRFELTYRQVLLAPEPRGDDRNPYFRNERSRSDYVREVARELLLRMAVLRHKQKSEARRLAETGRDPEDEVLATFLGWVSEQKRALAATLGYVARAPGTFEVADVKLVEEPIPLLRYRERPLHDGGDRIEVEETALLLLGWDSGPARFARVRGERQIPGAVVPGLAVSILDAVQDLLRDPLREKEQAALGQVLRRPAWKFTLDSLDQSLARIQQDAPAKAARQERIGYRVLAHEGVVIAIEPVLQKRSRSGAFSKGSRLDWFRLASKADIMTEADRRVARANDDRFVRAARVGWGAGPQNAAQIFGVLRALIDHPAVYLDGGSERRIDIRQGRLRLRFESAPDGSLRAQFDLMGLALTAEEVLRGSSDGRHVVHLDRPDAGDVRILLATLSAQAGAVVMAFAVSPAHFPPDAHDALAGRLETLQESMDIEFPSHWTRTISAVEPRLTTRLELLASGGLKVNLLARPVPLGPAWAPGEGPSLVLEGHGRDRHGLRRSLDGERHAALALVETLGLREPDESEPWCWRVAGGDPAFALCETLKTLSSAANGPLVEWADDHALLATGSVDRASMRLKVADRRDWFAVEGGARIEGQVVPLIELLAAIREHRRYVAVGKRGFARIEETLRQALLRADDALFENRGTLQVTSVGTDPLMALVDDEDHLAVSATWRDLRRRIDASQTLAVKLPPALDRTLRPYQRLGVEWMTKLAHWGAGAVLADEMGLGKTIQTLAVLSQRAVLGPAIVVAPTSVVANWVDEAARFAPDLTVKVHRGTERHTALARGLGPGDLLITSYAVATLDIEALVPIKFGTLVLDEAQSVKNPGTERARALRRLKAGWSVALTGTPIENHLSDLWSLFRIVSPGLFGSWEQFRARFAIPIEKFEDTARRDALAALIRPFVLRRTKSEVARELPARTEIVHPLTLSTDEQELYEQLRVSTLQAIAETKKDPDRDGKDLRFTLLAALTRLRQLCCHPRLVYPRATAGSTKLGYLVDLLLELRDGGHKALVFSQFRSFLDLVAPRLRQHGLSVLVLDGTTPAEQREHRVADFQAGKSDVFLISLKAGGFGLNLTAADFVIHLDPWWNPAVEDQASARAHRIGQTRPVTTIRLVARGTVEESVLNLHGTKRALAAAILSGGETAAQLSTEDLVALIDQGR